MKTKSYQGLKKRFLKHPGIRKAYEDLEPEYAIAQAVIARRMAKGMTQAALARKIGTKQSAIARLEAGATNPTIKVLEKVAQALDARLEVSFT